MLLRSIVEQWRGLSELHRSLFPVELFCKEKYIAMYTASGLVVTSCILLNDVIGNWQLQSTVTMWLYLELAIYLTLLTLV